MCYTLKVGAKLIDIGNERKRNEVICRGTAKSKGETTTMEI